MFAIIFCVDVVTAVSNEIWKEAVALRRCESIVSVRAAVTVVSCKSASDASAAAWMRKAIALMELTNVLVTGAELPLHARDAMKSVLAKALSEKDSPCV
jgi:siroheme synthase (precorrin-2 oxidase/ferrochelatase)